LSSYAQQQTQQQTPQKLSSGTLPTKALVLNFMNAFEAIYQPEMTKDTLDKYYNFMTSDVIDYHMAYNVVRKGAEGIKRSRKGLLNKAKSSIHYKLEVESIIIGSSTAVVVYREDARYIKNEKIKDFKGRTIQILEFDEHAKIKLMRRYQD